MLRFRKPAKKQILAILYHQAFLLGALATLISSFYNPLSSQFHITPLLLTSINVMRSDHCCLLEMPPDPPVIGRVQFLASGAQHSAPYNSTGKSQALHNLLFMDKLPINMAFLKAPKAYIACANCLSTFAFICLDCACYQGPSGIETQ